MLWVFSGPGNTAHICSDHADYSECGQRMRSGDVQKQVDESGLAAMLDEFSLQGYSLCRDCLDRYE